ncbi:unnamed protein product, partial [Didymodactylos carnosus]
MFPRFFEKDAFLPIRQRLINFYELVEEKIRKFNLFEPYPPHLNEERRYYELLSTRFYILILILSLIILVLYISVIDHTQTVIIKSPTLKQYTLLYEQHSSTLLCGCTKISILYSKFLQLLPERHEICTSQYVTDEWIQYIRLHIYSDDLNRFTDEFRGTAINLFQMLTTLCESTNRTIQNSLSIYYSTEYINDKLINQQLFEATIDSSIQLFISSIINTYTHSLQLIRDTTQSNGLVASNLILYYYYQQQTIVDRYRFNYSYYNNTNQTCSCTNTNQCVKQIELYSYLDPININMVVNGLYMGCYILESLLQSTLECFYSQQCFNQLNIILEPDYYLDTPISLLNSSILINFRPQSTIDELLSQLMVDQWASLVSYETYFNECQPNQCQYTYTEKFDIFYTITAILGIVGGLKTVLSFLIPNFIIKPTLYLLPLITNRCRKPKLRQTNQVQPFENNADNIFLDNEPVTSLRKMQATTKTTDDILTTTITSPLTTTKSTGNCTSSFSYQRNWNRTGQKVAGSSLGITGSSLKYLSNPGDMTIVNKFDLYISDSANNRIVKWKLNNSSLNEGELVIGRIDCLAGNSSTELNYPYGMTFDEINQQLYVADSFNYRVLRYNLNQTSFPLSGTTIIDRSQHILSPDVGNFYYIYYDHINNDLYLLETQNGSVLLYKNITSDSHTQSQSLSIAIVGQQQRPGGFYIDKQLSIYIADNSDNSIVKWLKESEQGIIVAGGYGIGSNLNQFDYPVAVFVDEQDSNTLYIADFGNSRVMQWLENATEGRTIIGTT